MAEGRLFVVATPIGNLEDITLRALRVLKECDRVLAEDTRHSGMLLAHFQIDKPLTSLHEHNERDRIEGLLGRLRAGEKLALVTDAGTPSVSDPGFALIRAAREEGLAVEVIPGASAVLTALVGSGLPTDAFAFVGFPPRKTAELERWSKKVLGLGMTAVFFESPHRIVDTLAALAKITPDRPAAVARELTKRYEEFVLGSLEEIRAKLSERDAIKGEITAVIAPALEDEASPEQSAVTVDPASEILRLRAEGKGDSEIAKTIAKLTGRNRREIYADLIKTKG